MFNFFKKRLTSEAPAQLQSDAERKPYAVAFVDYEHWYISYDRMYRSRPDIRAWRNALSERFDVGDIIFFGDFSNPSLRAEIPKIREITSYIIETQNASSHFEKDFTDFIMLDHIYQKAVTDESIDAFVIFSGDGHFSSVASFITNRVGKQVGVYAVKGALSSQLRNSATFAVEVAPGRDELESIIRRDSKDKKNSAEAHTEVKAQPKDNREKSGVRAEKTEEKADRSQRRHKSREALKSQPAKEEHTSHNDKKSERGGHNDGGKAQSVNDRKADSERRDAAVPDTSPETAANSTGRRRHRSGRHQDKADDKDVDITEAAAVTAVSEKPDKEASEPNRGEPQSPKQKPGNKSNTLQMPQLVKLKNVQNDKEVQPQDTSSASQPADNRSDKPSEKSAEKQGGSEHKAPLTITDGCRLILKNLDYLEKQNSQRDAEERKKALPTFWGTVEIVARLNRADKDLIRDAMQYLLEKGYVTQNGVDIDDKNVKVLSVDWDKSYGLYQRA